MKTLKLDELCLIQGGTCTASQYIAHLNDIPLWLMALGLPGAAAWGITVLYSRCGGSIEAYVDNGGGSDGEDNHF